MPAAACSTTQVGKLPFADRMPPPVEEERCVNAQLWLACAGSMCTVPPVGAAVYYFPEGHAEQATGPVVDLAAAPPLVPCRVVDVRFLAEPHTDEVYVKIRLVPLLPGEPVADVGDAAAAAGDDDGQPPKPASFAKTLTQSDANNGGGFSVPRFCAETIFPALDYRAEPPVQTLSARDVHGEEWTFRHIYRGTPRRHLLTTGWSNFVNKKRLLPGDSLVFVRGEDGGIHVGLRRAKRAFCDDDGGSVAVRRALVRGNAAGGGVRSPADGGKVRPEEVAAAARLAAAGKPFEVTHYPRASSPEFCVRAAAVNAAMQVPWCPGTRFKMAFETEDSSRVSWFMGTVSGVTADANSRWPQSPWRLLQVSWDEPELLRNVKRVCPWLVEQVSQMPNLHLPNFSSPPPRKKPRIPEFPFDGSQPIFPPTHPLSLPPPHHHHHHGLIPFLPFFPDGGSAAAAGTQGVRHDQPQLAPLLSDLRISSSNLQSLLLYGVGGHADHHHAAPPAPPSSRQDAPPRFPSSPAGDAKKNKPVGIMLFGREILTEEQTVMKRKRSGGAPPTSPEAAGIAGSSPNNKPGGGCDADQRAPSTPDSGVTEGGSPTKNSLWCSEFGLEPGQCKVFMESDAVGRNLDLSELGSFEELCARLSAMFCIDDADLRSHVRYRTAAGEVKNVGDEPFSAFVKSARRITIPSDAGSDNTGSQ
nr:unnamed protein product [Digitaria exilis]